MFEEYEKLVDEVDVSKSPISLIDQNISHLRDAAKDVGINLLDAETLDQFKRVHALVLAWYLHHITSVCDVPACRRSAVEHARSAGADLGAHLRMVLTD